MSSNPLTRGASYAIPSIPTEYNGYVFRSRAEARFAKFFDCLGIKYEYEPEGFVLKSGQMYMPDFYLPHVSMWAEVKPTYLEPREEQKASLLAELTGQKVLFLVGSPDFKSYYAATWDCGYYTVTDYSLDIFQFARAWSERRFYSQPCYGHGKREDRFSAEYIKAVNEARAARFQEVA